MYNPEIYKGLQDRIRDNNDGVNDASFADSVAFLLRILLQDSDITLPTDAKYLATGAGQAKAELALAAKLGIDLGNVTLLDKRFSPHAQAARYDVASAFGMEYVCTDIARTEQLIAGLSRILNPNGIALLAPYDIDSPDVTPIWNRYGFVSLNSYKDERPFSYQMVLRNTTY